MTFLKIPKDISEIDEDVCRKFDDKMNSRVNRQKVAATGYNSFHMAACSLLLEGESLSRAARKLGSTRQIVSYATGKFGLRWKRKKRLLRKDDETIPQIEPAPRPRNKSKGHAPYIGRLKNCSSCGASFTTTPKRFLLCAHCFCGASDDDQSNTSLF